MATTRTFNDMLNDYLAYKLLQAETIKRNYLLTKVEIDEDWRGGDLIVPFRGGNASSISYGSLTAEDDVTEDKYVRGAVSGYKEIWGTMKFNARDFMEHDGGGVNEQSFLKNLPSTIERFLDDMKQAVSVNLLNGIHIATVTTSPTGNDGLLVVDHPERFSIDQKVIVDDSSATNITAYVKAINMNTKTLTLSQTRQGTVTDFSGATITTGQSAKVYHPGTEYGATTAFTSLKDQLLSAANGGSSTLFGVSKVLYPYLQATNYDGAACTPSNFLDKLFDFVTQHRRFGRAGANELLMSYTLLGVVMKLLETKSGPFRHVNTESNIYGWTTITIVGVKGEFKITGIQEMDDDVVFLMDWRAAKLHTNKGFRRHKDPEGLGYYTVRATTGYSYFVDLCMYGEFVVSRPELCGVMHSIPSTVV